MRTSRDYFCPPPPQKKIEKKWTIYLLYLYVGLHFRRIFIEFVENLAKNIDLSLQLNIRERAVQWAVFGPPPFHTKK